MKKLFVASAVALFGLANAQENSVKVNPFALLGGSDLVSYERAIGGNSSVGIGASIGGFKLGGLKYSSGGAGAFYRYYFGQQALKGWYGLGGVSYNGGKVKAENVAEYGNQSEGIKFGAFGVNVKAGYQWIWNSGFTLDLNAGIGYTSLSYENENKQQGDINLQGSGILPSLGVGLGYSF